tara:strand:- start:532 stop:888 length:357 start_codon:yes stop_codon:yes gene_type:complete
MRPKNNTKQRKKPIQGLRSFRDSLPKDIRKIILNKADTYSKIIDNWKKIVGNDLFEACYPKSFKNIKNSGIKQLNIMVKRGKEVDVEYSRKIIIDRINSFLGYEFINSIKLVNYKDKK